MARMIPENIDHYGNATEGAKKTFLFLKEAARPHRDFTCWVRPIIRGSGKAPDFLLFGKRLGLLVIEVRDWTSGKIISYNPRQFTLQVSGGTEKISNPDREAKGYAGALAESLKEIPDFQGEPGVPIGWMVVFPHMREENYRDRGLQWLIPKERVLLQEDLVPGGEILRDPKGRIFFERISDAFPFRFRGLPKKIIETLSFTLSPESRIQIPERKGTGKIRFLEEVRALDERQARFAQRLGHGHRIIKGPPGSGKTLVLVHRYCHLFRYEPRIKRILLACYNIALVSYLKRLVQEKGFGMGEGGGHILHFYQLCSRVLGEPVHFENEDPEYYAMVIQRAIDRINKGKSALEPFDAILIDEAQDFSNEMLKTLLSLLRAEGDLVISLDTTQDLYRRRTSWNSLGIKARGHTHLLNRVYRNTREIFDFSRKFIGEFPGKGQMALFPTDAAYQGDPPDLRALGTREDVEAFLIGDIAEGIDRGDYKRSEIAIIYDDKVYGTERFSYDNRALPMRILKRLETSDIPTTWVSQDVRAKEMFDTTADRVSLISIHSAKGLDFDLVYLIGMDHIHPTGATKDKLISLLYVAMTRAKYRLVIPYIEETAFIKRMKTCLPDQR